MAPRGAHTSDILRQLSLDNSNHVAVAQPPSTFSHSLIQPGSTLPSYTNDWTPQPQEFTIREWNLFQEYGSTYVLKRFGNLQSAVQNFVANITWTSTAHPASHLQNILDTHKYLYTARDSPAHTLLSPTFVAIAQSIDGNNFDEFGCWAWAKARVCMCSLLCESSVRPFPALRDDLNQPSIDPNSVERLVTLIHDLLKPFIAVANRELCELRQCFSIAALVSLGMQRDLRPWRFSFAHDDAEQARLNHMAPLRARQLAPFSVTCSDTFDDFVSQKTV
ncbi:hypothetical protein IFR05_000584 [Cadophora sp. M221]|nr:hypothetical protein IFR05_000584 [Cadophora sp. M221]